MSGGVRQNAADTKSVPLNEGETPSTAAEIRALAEQAEAEAAEAEALAAAARARARAIQLRREAELAEAKQQQATEEADAKADGASQEAEDTGSVQTEVQETPPETEPEDTESTVGAPPACGGEAEGVETEERPDDAVAEADADTSADEEKPPRRRSRISGRLRRPKWSTIAACLAIVVIFAALAGSGYMIKEHRDAVRQQQRAAEFAAAARQGVVTLTSLDFNNAKQGVQRIADNSTGSFRDDFLKMADDFTKVVEQSKVVSRGTVQATAVELDSMTDIRRWCWLRPRRRSPMLLGPSRIRVTTGSS